MSRSNGKCLGATWTWSAAVGSAIATVYRTARRPARRAAAPLTGLALAALGLAGCVTTPVTGRMALNAFSVGQDRELGEQAYAEVRSSAQIVESGPQKAMVERCMQRLVAVADDPGFDWEVVLIQDDQTVNAFCLPGGKMAVYTGILPVCDDPERGTETGLAVVMGHEIAHAVARHGTERLTHAYGFDIAIQLATEAAGGDSAVWGDLANTTLQLTFGLPHGRDQESESDRIGLIYMARAGYDPRAAVDFWSRMNRLGGDGGPPEFLSTHPSHETRVRELQEWMPDALAEYQAP